MPQITKTQLSELEQLLATLEAYLEHQGAPKSLVGNVHDMTKSINWVKARKARKKP